MPVEIEKKQGVGKTSVQDKNGASVDTEETVGDLEYGEDLANVGLTLSYTKNLGNFNSVKVQVSLHRPCENIDPEIEATFAKVEDWVDTKMQAIVSELPDAE